jgi:multidrug efflux system membrane fusion protein
MVRLCPFRRKSRPVVRIRHAAGASGALLLAGMLWLPACTKGKAAAPADPPKQMAVPVTVAAVVQRTVPVQVRTFGWVEPYAAVTVKARVDGQLTEVHFKEGQSIKKGALLFKIDSRPFEAALAQAKANVARDTVQAKNARREAERGEQLLNKGALTQEQADQRQTAADALDATLLADQALIDNAKLQLDYCTISSPIDGCAGPLLVDQGNLIKANDVSLVTINQIKPIYVRFSVLEELLPDIRRYMSQRKLEADGIIPDDAEHPVRGELTFVDNTVDDTTGMIRLKATFANEDERLWPGQYVNVTLTLTHQDNATVVPSEAVQTGQQGQYVFAIKGEDTVEIRPVVVDRALNTETVIQKGLQAGERVVTDGQLRLVDGAKVEIKSGK